MFRIYIQPEKWERIIRSMYGALHGPLKDEGVGPYGGLLYLQSLESLDMLFGI